MKEYIDHLRKEVRDLEEHLNRVEKLMVEMTGNRSKDTEKDCSPTPLKEFADELGRPENLQRGDTKEC